MKEDIPLHFLHGYKNILECYGVKKDIDTFQKYVKPIKYIKWVDVITVTYKNIETF